MNTKVHKTLKALERKLFPIREMPAEELRRAYELTLKLRSQLIGVIYEQEIFGMMERQSGIPKFADLLSDGKLGDEVATLTIYEQLPSIKELTASVQEHWLELIHTAIAKAAREHKLPRFEKAFVWIEVITPKGTDNARLWDTSNRAVNLIINNLKGVFFEDDNLEHMAFGVVGKWGEKGVTIVRIMPMDRLEQIIACNFTLSP